MKFNLSLFLIFLLLHGLFISADAQKKSLINQQTQQYDSLQFSKLQKNHTRKNIHLFTGSQFAALKKQNNFSSNIIQGATEGSSCYDTSGRFLLKTDKYTYYPEGSIRSKDGLLLISGECYNNETMEDGGFLIKSDDFGNIKWAKFYDSLNHQDYSWINYYHLIELKDGAIILAGSTADPITGNNDVILTKTDAYGNIIWSRTFKSRLWRGTGTSSDNYFYIQEIKQDEASGDIFFTGPYWANSKNIVRLNITDGAVKWSKVYQLQAGASFDRPFGIDITSSEILSFSSFIYYNDIFLNIYRINKNTGDTLQTKFFKLSDTAGFKAGLLGHDPLKKLDNGHYIISGLCYGYYQYMWDGYTPLYQSSIVEFDENLNFIKGIAFKNNTESNGENRVTIYPDGSGIFGMQQYISSYTCNIFYVQFKNNQILKQRKRYYTEGVPALNYPLKLKDGGDLSIKLLGDTVDNINKIEFLKLHLSDTASECLGINDNSTSIYNLKYIPATFGFDSIMSGDFYDAPNKTLVTSDLTLDLLPGCKRISYCDTVKIIALKDTVCVGKDALFRLRKNPACGAIPYFDFDTSAAKSFTQLNDSTFNFHFSTTWKGFIHASLNTCQTVQDSAMITVLTSPKQLYLGSDTSICPGNTINLNAHTGFISYKWQDNSTDSAFNVTQPGKYYVTAKNACGDFFTDTILVSAHPPIPFNAGPDITLCEGDTAIINAPAGFTNYQWLPLYNISGNSTKTAKVFPGIDTTYTVSAEKIPGCFVYDTVHITVNQIPEIHLGNDTSFCAGQSLLLDAGPGFNSYKWNNGSAAQTITVTDAGKFYVTATLNNCKRSDTLSVLNISPLPNFTLGNDTTLCEKESLTYQFNLQNAIYSWSNGSNLNSNTISQAGTYWLSVSQQGCASADTVSVAYKPLPIVDLGSDTTLCEGKSLLLDASNNNATYAWQDGNTNAIYSVNNAGRYFVAVNMNDCVTKDTININYTQLPNFTLGSDLLLCKGIAYKLEPVLNTAVDYLWQDGSSASFFNVNTDGLYILRASNNCGVFTDSVKVTTAICQLQMPSAFTPNNDGKNDLFRVIHPFPVSQFHMVVYNRWGQKIYESSDIYKGWNGTFNNTLLSPGSYIWMISLTTEDGKKQQSKGTVVLVR